MHIVIVLYVRMLLNSLSTLYVFQNITNKVLRSIARKEWSSALGVFSALKHVILLQPDIDRACDSVQRQQLSGVLNKLQQTVSITLLSRSVQSANSFVL